MIDLIVPDWPVPPQVRALVTTRLGGVSAGAYAGLNVATHVDDDPQAVQENRRRLRQFLPSDPHWLQQVHGRTVLRFDSDVVSAPRMADAAVTSAAGVVLAVQSADCLPVLLADVAGQQVAALHAGWRGLADGIVAEGVRALATPPAAIYAWLGPAIGPQAFEVGAVVREAFMDMLAGAEAAFQNGREGHYLADLYTLGRLALTQAGVLPQHIFGGGFCTVSEPQRFYSYRRDGVTGRMASLIWIAQDQ